ncbi:hypothetical protein D9M72_190820 [compost metagenome]
MRLIIEARLADEGSDTGHEVDGVLAVTERRDCSLADLDLDLTLAEGPSQQAELVSKQVERWLSLALRPAAPPGGWLARGSAGRIRCSGCRDRGRSRSAPLLADDPGRLRQTLRYCLPTAGRARRSFSRAGRRARRPTATPLPAGLRSRRASGTSGWQFASCRYWLSGVPD